MTPRRLRREQTVTRLFFRRPAGNPVSYLLVYAGICGGWHTQEVVNAWCLAKLFVLPVAHKGKLASWRAGHALG